MRMLKFGGPNLPPGTHTWYERRRDASASGNTGVVTVMVYPGDMIPADVVVKDTGLTNAKGEPILQEMAESYVTRGMATFVTDKGARHVYPAPTKK